MTEGNQQDPPPEAPEKKPGALPLPGQRNLDPKDKKGHFQPADPPQTEENGGAGEKRGSSLPEGPKAVWRREVKRPGTEQFPEAPANHEMSEESYGEPRSDSQWVESSRKGARGLAPAVEERRRQRMAALLGVTEGVERLPDSDQIVFSCPICHERIQCDDTELGKERVCSSCRSEYKLPEDDRGGQITLLRLDPQRGQASELPAAFLPDGRGVDGRSNEAHFQPVEELLSEGNEVVVEWGLEKYESKPESAKFRWLWALAAFLVLGCAAGFLLRHVQQSSGRTDPRAASPGDGLQTAGTESGGLDWASIPPSRIFLMADATIRTYFSAPNMAAKAVVSRGGENTLARMKAHYGIRGGYEAEIRTYGDVRSVQILEDRPLGGQKFLMVRVRFQRGNTGVMALLKAKERLEVDWDYAVGYGEIDFEKLLFERPANPVLLRVYLRKANEFSDGFTSTGYRNFDMKDPARGFRTPVYVALGSAADSRLQEAWSDREANVLGGSQGDGRTLSFTLKVRYENSGGRRGFHIDEVLAKGWIVPDSSP